MKSKHLLLMLLLAFMMPWAAKAQTQNATLYDGTASNSFVPMYTSYCDDGFTSEYIIPASAFENENIYPGSQLHSITLYQNQTNPWVAVDLTIKLTNTETESYSSAGLLGSSGTTVYTNASYSANSASSHTYEFSSSFEYTGGSLIVQISAASGGTWKGSSWYGTTTTTNQGYYIYGSYTGSLQKFIPKTTFNYTPGTAPATPKPTNFAVSNILHNQADLSWTENGTATSWQICVNDDETNLITTTDNPHTLTGLTPTTAYTVKVRSVGTPNSDWSASKTFTTTAQATAVGDSWSDDFEGATCGWDLINGTLTNKWCWGTTVSNGGTHALYVSQDNGTNNTYTSSGTKIFAAKLLSFTEGKFNFSFDWKCKGENNYDFLRVALVPASQTLTAGSDYSTIGYSSLPSGWIAVDGGSQLNQSSATTPTWQNKEAAVNVSAGNYYLVLVWRNDSDVYNPAAAVDNVSITRLACPYDVTGLTVSGITTSGASLSWTAGEATQWQVAYATTSNFASAHEEIVSAATYPMAGLTDATHYYVKVRAYCGGSDYGSWSSVVEFDTKCLPTTVPNEGWTENFDDLTVASNSTAPAARVLPTCWSAINTTTYTSYKPFPTAYYYSSTNYAKSTPNCLKFYSYYSSWSDYDPQPQYAILPEMDNLAGMRIKLWARGYNATSTFKIGRMTDPEDASTFVQIGEEHGFTSENYQTYQEITVELTGTGNYIAIMIDAANSSNSTIGVYIDDIRVEPIPSCTEPSDLECTATTTTTATLSWTAGGTETKWDIFVTSDLLAEPASYTIPTVSATTDNPATVPGLTAATTYHAWVRAHCSDSDQSPWVGGISFATDCESITTFPWTENFEGMTANTAPMCWDNSATTGTDYGSHPEYYWGVYEYNENKMIRMYNYYAHGPLAIINSPTIDLPAEAKELTFDYTHNANSGAFSVKISVDGGTTFTELQQYTKGSGSSNSDPGTFTEATISLADYTNKSVILQFYSEANYGSGAIFVDNIRIDNLPTCIKPSGLTKDATTAHTATLHWTNGAATQNAWQIAYSTTADFDPSTVTPVDVTTNPATIEGLAQSTTYYAYVRAYCGGTDYSAWNSTKVTFSTVAGNVTPTGLAVASATITSDEAVATWNAVAGNTLHEYYQIYWAEATVTSVPDEPAAPNLITNITATSQLIEGLNPETQYKVWVRDICGTDGNSNWSSAVTFTTAADCQTPDGLAASNVTNESATITWNTYGQEGFNLQYRISGEEWDANNIIPNVSTPYTLNPPLIGSTTYEVRVQAACTTDDSWSSALSFKTQCDPVSFPWSENFDEWESKSECWSFLSGQYNNGNGPATTYSSAWPLSYSNTYGSIELSGKALQMNLYSTNRYWAVTPTIDITTDDALLTVDVAVAAWSSATPNFDDNDTLAFAISTNGGATFTSLRVLDGAELNTLDNNYTTIYVPVTGYNGQAVRFAIFGGSISGTSPYDNRCVIDNVTVMETPSCYPVGTLSAATDVTYNSAKLSWALVDDTQDEWTVQYATDENFTNIVDTKTATTNTNYELTGLTPETHYWVRVKAACSTTDDWSNAVDFTTDVFCAVTGLTAGTTTQTTADLSWTGASDSYNIQYRTAAGTDELWFEGFENETAYNQWTLNNCVSGSTRSTEAKRTDDYGFKFAYNGFSSGITPPQYLISPDLSAYTTNEVTVEFYYKKGSNWNETFIVGWSSTTNSPDAFTWDDHGDYSATQLWQAYTHTIPAGTKYVAIAYTADDQMSMYIDDFTIGAPIAAGTWQNATSETASKQLTGLAAGTKYDVQVQGVCGGTAGSWSTPIYSFTTLPFTKTITGVGNDNWDEQNGGYYLIASPVTNAITPSADNGFVTSNYDLYAFDQSEELEWRNYNVLVETEMTHPNFTTIENGKGYLYASKTNTTLSFTGEVNTNGTVTLSKSGSGNLAGWNLVGNPFGEDAYINKPFYTLENSDTYTSNEASTAIHAMQGLFVVANEDGEMLTFTTEAPSKSAKLNMNLRSGDKQLDNAILVFGGEQQLGKFSFSANSSKIYMPVEGKEYAVATAEGNVGEMPVSFKAEKNGSYTLSFTNEEVTFSYLHLIDNMTGNDVNLLETPNYSFDAKTTDYESRFRLVFATGTSVDDNTFGFVNAMGNFCIFGIEGEATVQVIDMLGHVISSETFSGSYERKINGAPGVYMVRLINGDNVMVQKIVVR